LKVGTVTSPWKLSKSTDAPSPPPLLEEPGEASQGADPITNAAGESNKVWLWLLALGLLLLPFFVGYYSVRAWSKASVGYFGRKWPHRLLLVAISLVCAVAILLLPGGLWDTLAALVVLALGGIRAAVGFNRKCWPRLDAMVLGAVLLTLVLLEIGARTVLPFPPVFPDIRLAKLATTAPFTTDQEACTLLYPDSYPSAFAERAASAEEGKRLVLHLGDSMVYWWGGVKPEESTIGVLNRLDENVSHVSAAVAGTGPEYHLLIARRWLQRLHPDLVVLHICLTNDVAELGRAWPCCDDLPLLVKTPDGPKARCEVPRNSDDWGFLLQEAINKSPPPFLVRVATDVSLFARHLGNIFIKISSMAHRTDTGPVYSNNIESFLELVRVLRDELRTKGIPLVVVLTPYRSALDHNMPHRDKKEQQLREMQQAIESLSIPVLNAQERFAQAAREPGFEELFLNDISFDIHLSIQGHNMEAHWLYENLYQAAGWRDLVPGSAGQKEPKESNE